MNERYFELVRESTVPADHSQEYARSRGLVDNLDEKLDIGRYTEAVVRECCRALNPQLRDMISRGQGCTLILEHFGIDPREISLLMLDRSIARLEQQLADRPPLGTAS